MFVTLARRIGWSVSIVSLLASVWMLVVPQERHVVLPEATVSSHRPLFTGLELKGYEPDQSQFTVQAARGYATKARIGFFETPLIPTLELEELTVRRVHPDGTTESFHEPTAFLNWFTKTLLTPQGEVRLGGNTS